MRFERLVSCAPAVVESAIDPAEGGLSRLAGGMTHDVFVPVDDPSLVVKVFRSGRRDAPEREWDALKAVAGLGISPDPLHFDSGSPSVVVMTRATGACLTAGETRKQHAIAIGNAHRLVHTAVPGRQRGWDHASLQVIRTALMRDLGVSSVDGGSGPAGIVGKAWHAAQVWIADSANSRPAPSERLRFCRGDPNLSNYLWDDGDVVLIDWEHSGYGDPALELADMAEHASTRALGEDFWVLLADATELTQQERTRVAWGRRLTACFWLVLIEGRQRQGLPTTVTLEEQAERTLATLGE